MKSLEMARAVVRRKPLYVLAGEEWTDIGGFSQPSKMPWLAWSTPVERCRVGSRLRKVPGSTCSGCYAMTGWYRVRQVKDALEGRFDKLTDLPFWVSRMVLHITERASRFTPTPGDAWPAFRWHDAGDIQGVRHLDAICKVARKTQDVRLADGSIQDVRYWLPTREYTDVATFLRGGGRVPRNLVIRLSAHMIDGPAASGGLPVSTVQSTEGVYPEAWICPAQRQGHKCLSCRACWDAGVQHVSYPYH